MGIRTVVVVFGMSGHGKDTLSDMIAEEIGRDRVLRCAFADPLKTAAQHLVGMPRSVAYGSQQDKANWRAYDRTARQWLQIIGTEVGRVMIHPDVWVDRLADVVRAQPDTVTTAIVSDGRFRNEREKLSRRLEPADVMNVLIWRGGVPLLGHPPTTLWRAAALLTGLPLIRHILRAVGFGPVMLMHPSEAEVWGMRRRHESGEDLFDLVVANNGTLDELREHAKKIARSVLTVG